MNGGTASCPTYGAYLQQTERLASNGTTQIGPIETTYFDALGRIIASDSQGFDGSNRRVATQYDSKGRVSQTSRPYFTTGGTAKWTVYTYDALDRVTKAVFPDTSQTTYTFNGLTTSLTNNLSQTTSKTLNAQGLPASVTDAASHVTHYVYDAFNDLTSVTDPSGNVISNTYDIRGRKTGSADPDMGSWIYNYDVLSELTSQTDAKSQITNLTYDLLGRVKERTEADMVSDWIYDSATHGIGRLQATCTSASSNPTCTSALTTKTFTYDATGRPSTSTINTDATNFTYSTTYNATNGAVDTVTYPSSLVTKNVYNSYGYVCSITDTAGSPTCTSGGGSNVFFTANTADAELHILQQTAGNSVVTTDTFDANTGLLTNVRSGPSNAVAQFDYTYDTIGNLTYRSDDFLGVFERYCYDNLNRLTNSATGASGVTLCTSSGTGITTKTIGYDQLGDITSKSDVGTYSYPASGSGSVQPHAVSSIAGTVNGVTNPSYTYDLNGNMTVGAGLTATYTSFNMAATITQGSTTIGLAYGSDHQRIKQCIGTSCATSTTYYLNDPATGAMSEQFVAGATTTWRDFLRVGGQIVGERFSVVGGSTSWSYFVIDHLGSVAVNTDSTGTVTERLSYDAWGRRRNSDGTDNGACSIASATTRGFTGHEEMDAICQINANARVYDPTIGRFMTADALIPHQLVDQSLNRYSYVENGPLSGTDPSGNEDSELHPAPVSGGIDFVVVTAERQPSPDLSVKSGDFLEVASGPGTESATSSMGVQELVVVTAEKYASQFLTALLPSLNWIKAHVIGEKRDPNEGKSCLTASLELSFGLQAGIEGQAEVIGGKVLGDAGTFRLTIGTDGASLRATQGFSLWGSLGIPDTPVGFSVGGTYGRSGAVGINVAPAQALANQPGQLQSNTLSGIDAGMQLLFGAEFRAGYDPMRGTNAMCVIGQSGR